MIKLDYILFSNFSGFAFAAKNNVEALSPYYDIKVSILDLGFNKKINSNNYDQLVELSKKQFDPQRIQILHSIPDMGRKFPLTAVRISYATFEAQDPPLQWYPLLNRNKAIIAPSKFNYDIFNNFLLKVPIFYIPHCLDFNKYNINIVPKSSFTNIDKFKFLFMGAWKERKNYDLLIKSYFEEFSGNNNVLLVLKTNSIYGLRPENHIVSIKNSLKLKHYPDIIVDSSLLDDDQIPFYIKSFDCFVLPTMGEGFGLPPLQSMAVGVPVIITDFSGCKDYANEQTAILLKPEGFIFKECVDGIPQFIKKKWPYISKSQLREKMRLAYENKIKREEIIKNAYDYVKENFNYDIVLKCFNKMFEKLNNLP